LDEFFQTLREIQKKERSMSGLSSVGDNFYTDVSNYLNALMRKIDDNPFSFESYLLRDAQRIGEEICERREHKIANNAVMNVQRARQLFKESKGKRSRIKKENPIAVPVNSTPEEEDLYFQIVDSLVKYRERMVKPLRSYLHKNETSLEAHEESRNDTSKSSVATSSQLQGKPEDEVHSQSDSVPGDLEAESLGDVKRSKGPVKGDPSGFEDQIYEIYGSEPSKQTSEKEGSKGSNSGVSNERNHEAHETVNSQGTAAGISSSNVSDLEGSGHGSSITLGADETSDTLKPVASDGTSTLKTLLILDELPSILGVDKNVYGPVIPQDIVTMPEANAKVLIKNRKGMAIQRYK